MTVSEFLLPELRDWVEARRESLAVEGVLLHLDGSRSEWAKASMALELQGPDLISQLTVWASGEAELERGEVVTGRLVGEHRELASVDDLRRSLDDLVRWQREGPGRS